MTQLSYKDQVKLQLQDAKEYSFYLISFFQAKMLAGPIALLKLRATRASYHISDEANQILGGRAITRSGMVYLPLSEKS